MLPLYWGTVRLRSVNLTMPSGGREAYIAVNARPAKPVGEPLPLRPIRPQSVKFPS